MYTDMLIAIVNKIISHWNNPNVQESCVYIYIYMCACMHIHTEFNFVHLLMILKSCNYFQFR